MNIILFYTLKFQGNTQSVFYLYLYLYLYFLYLYLYLYLYFYFLLPFAIKTTSPATVKKRIPKIIYGNKNKNQESLDHPNLHNKLRTNAHNKINNTFNK